MHFVPYTLILGLYSRPHVTPCDRYITNCEALHFYVSFSTVMDDITHLQADNDRRRQELKGEGRRSSRCRIQ